MNDVRMHAQLWAYQDRSVDPDGTVKQTAGPVATGVIASDGTIANAVPVDSITGIGSSNNGYAIDIDGEDDDRYEYATIVTPNAQYLTETCAIGATPSARSVSVTETSGTTHPGDFQFVPDEVAPGSVTTSTPSTSMADLVGDSS
jgi:hypothetical protein